MSMTAFTRKQHRWRAFIALGVAFVLALVPGLKVFFSDAPAELTFLLFPSWALAAWGYSHLARLRGYRSSMGYAVFFVIFVPASYLVAAVPNIVLGLLANVVMTILIPTIVLLMLRRKRGTFRRQRSERPRQDLDRATLSR